MSKSRIAAAAALLAVAGAANADTSVTAAWVSEYDWRGLPQSPVDAVQLSGTYTSDSGFYAGAWGSSLVGQAEIDVFAGFAGDIGDSGLGYDLGINYYTYTQTDGDQNFGELYAGLNYGMFGAKVWWSNDFANSDESAFYVEGNATVPLADSGFNFLAHVGYSTGDGIEAAYVGSDDSYLDWSAGLGYDVGNFSTFVKYVDGSDNEAYDSVASRVVFGISTTLPWGE
jgi:uncharacterized protein (TIGR02001 family)